MGLLGQRKITEKPFVFVSFFAIWGSHGGMRESLGGLAGGQGSLLGPLGSFEVLREALGSLQGGSEGLWGRQGGSHGEPWGSLGALWGPNGGSGVPNGLHTPSAWRSAQGRWETILTISFSYMHVFWYQI